MKRTASLLALAILAGCMRPSPAVVLHTLRPLTLEEGRPAPTKPPISLEVMPVQVPELIQRPQLLNAQGPERWGLSETHHWGNPIEKDIQRVLVENLCALLGSDSIVAYPGGDHVKAPYRFSLDIQQFEAQPGGSLKLRATWMLTRISGGQALLLRKANLQEAMPDQNPDTLVAAHSRVLAALSRDIAAELRSVPAEKKEP